MNEKIITLDSIEPVEIYGVNDVKLNIIKKHFPKLKLIARGYSLKAIGDSNEITRFEKRLELLVDYYHKSGILTDTVIDRLLGQTGDNLLETKEDAANSDIILFGNNGLVIKAKTDNQRKMLSAIVKNDMLFAIGPAGTGKTYTAVALAIKALKNKEVKRIILTRPAVEAGENLGFLPGDLKEKLDPYMQPLYDALNDMVPGDKLNQYIENRIIQIAPLAFMRGRTLDNAFVILDEAQNTTESQMKMFLTRMGANAKFIVTGDVTQIDLPSRQPSGLVQAVRYLKKVEGISIIELDNTDVIRHKLVKAIIESYESNK
ncbi:MAG: PhoH family protein [Bacteroidota bacterium]|nr:PhoH family protein [Bacteroidota bacterium]MDP3144321.1 PhoH family protein [Bacteroidota bacterium]MDP3556307.1 PhoH family protein [Bacteroidota bacterium]